MTATHFACVLFPARQKFPLHISQDGNNTAVAELARSTEPATFNLTHVDPSQIPVIVHMQHIQADNFPTRKKSEPVAYYRIASHYKFVMRQMFDCWQYPKLIILEVCMHALHCLWCSRAMLLLHMCTAASASPFQLCSWHPSGWLLPPLGQGSRPCFPQHVSQFICSYLSHFNHQWMPA